MKLKRITDEEIKRAEYSVIDQAYVKGCPNSLGEWFIGTEKLIPLQKRAIVQAQLEADQKVLDVLELAQEGYTEMAVREIFEEIEKMGKSESGLIVIDPFWDGWLTYKQNTPKKYGGEK